MRESSLASVVAAMLIAVGCAICVFVFYLDALSLFAPVRSPAPTEITIRTAR